MTVASDTAGTPVWYRELGATATGLRLAEAWTSDEHADGVYTTARPRRASLVWRTTASAEGMLHVNVPPDRAPDAPALWYVPVDDPDAEGCTLVAYLGGEVSPGTVVPRLTLDALELDDDARLGTVRWRRSGLVVELYVAREHRRQDVGLSLVHAAGAWHQANRWPGFIYADAGNAPSGALDPVSRRHPSRVRGPFRRR